MASTNIPTIQVEVRTEVGTRSSTRLRDSGRMPAVIYGHRQEPVHISMDTQEITDLLHRNAHVMEVAFDSNREPCLVKNVQWNHLGSKIMHLDLTRVDLTEKVKTHVVLELTGEPVALKEAGTLLEHPYSEIEVECLAANIPDRISADISQIDLNQPLTVGDLELPEGVICTLTPETPLASITIMAEEVEPDVTPEAEEGEPEVIGEKKPDEADPEAEAKE